MIYLEIKKKHSAIHAFRVRRFTQGVLKALNKSHVDLSLVLTGDREIRRFNRKYLHHDRPTDVLAFTAEENPGLPGVSGAVPARSFRPRAGGGDAKRRRPLTMDKERRFSRRPLLGDVMISLERARIYAKRFGNTVWDEVKLYIVHGILHLLGYDDHKPKERARMRRKEQAILKRVRT